MKKLRLFMCFLMLFLLAVIFSYSQKIETKNGVRIVHNEKKGRWGERPMVTLKLVRTIGDIDVDDENLTFRSPEDVALDKAGNIHILDSGNHRIQKFSPKGKFMATIGRLGQGPGEFYNPNSLDIDSRGYLYVSERWNNRIQVLTPGGKGHKTVQIIKDHPKKVRCLKSGWVARGGIPSLGLVLEKDKNLLKLIKLFDLEGNVRREFGDMFRYDNKLLSWYTNWFDFDIDKDDNFYLTFNQANRIEKYSPEGKLIWRADRVLNYSMKPQDKYEIAMGSIGRTPAPPRVSNGIAVDEKGRAWVVTLNRQRRKEEQYTTIYSPERGKKTLSSPEIKKMDIYKLEIYDSDGVLLGEIQLDHIAHGIRIQKDYLFIWDMRNTKYYQYKIIEK